MRGIRRPAFSLIGAFLIASALQAQEIRPDFRSDPKGSGGYRVQWDSANDRLVLFRNTDVSAVAAARVLNWKGKDITIRPLKDLPDAQVVTSWAAAATPEGGLVLAVIANYGPRGATHPLAKSLLLTYDSQGKMTRIWDVDPYHYHHIAVDQEGNVFAFGHRDPAPGSDYPLIVEYSPEGSVKRQLLPLRLFPSGDRVVDSGSPNGESRLFVQGQELFLWLAPTQELLRFSLTGNLKSRVSLAPALKGVAEAVGGSRTEVSYLGATQRGAIAQVQVWPKAPGGTLQRGMIEFSADGSRATPLAPLTEALTPGRFVGTTSAGKRVFLDRDGAVRQQ